MCLTDLRLIKFKLWSDSQYVKAKLPDNEAKRLAALREYQILDSVPEPPYDDIVQLAAQLCGTSIALISFVDNDRQWFKALKGLDVTETVRELAFCAHAILNPKEVLVVENPTTDERFSDNALVLGSPHIRFYAGAPIASSSGLPLGTLCVIESHAKSITPEQIRSLQALARLVETQLELRKELAVKSALQRERELLLESTSEGVYGVDLQGCCTFMNRAAAKMLGVTVEEILGHNVFELIQHMCGDGGDGGNGVADDSKNRAHDWSMFQNLQTGTSCRIEDGVLWRKDGTALRVEYRAEPTLVSGNRVGNVVTFSDITERKAAKAKLKEQADMLIHMGEIAKIGAWELDVETQHTTWSPEIYRIHEVAQDTPTDVAMGIAFYAPEAQQKIEQAVRDCIVSRKPFDIELPFRTAKGKDLYVRAQGRPTVFDGKVTKLTGALQDITELKDFEAKLKDEQARLTLALDSGKIGLWDYNLLTNVKQVSERFAFITGYSVAMNESGQLWETILHKEDKERVLEALRIHRNGLSPEYNAEYRIRTKSGEWRWVTEQARVYERDDQGKAIRMIGTLLDIHARRTQEIALRETNSALHAKGAELSRANQFKGAILHSAGYAIITWNLDGLIHTLNPAAVNMLGYRAEELMGKSSDIFHDSVEVARRAKEFSDELKYLIEPGFEVFVSKAKAGLANEHEWTYIRKDGSRLSVLLTVTSLRDDANKICGYLGVAVDISAQKELREHAQAATVAKSEFLANMSHEIRTPMNGILGMTELLLETQLNAEQKALAQDAHSSAKSLLAIINDILDISKVEAGKMEIHPVNFKLEDLRNSVLAVMKHEADIKGIELISTVAKGTASFYLGDDLRMRQVLLNLIGNAIKFTPDGGAIVLNSGLESNEAGESCLRFTVTDTGIGIPQNKVELVFGAFSQADSGTTRKFGGTGLGLSISRMLAKLMGGHLSVSSKEGVGSAFSFTAKVTVLDADEFHAKPAVNNLPSSGDRQAAKPILLVEDNLVNQRLALRILEKLGQSVVIANNGQEALDRLANEPEQFGMVLMDCQMPILSGYDATKMIRKSEACTGLHLPIVAMTANAMEGDREKCIVAGMDEYLTKPIDRARLAEMIAKYSR